MLSENTVRWDECGVDALAGFTLPEYGRLLDAIYRGPLENPPWAGALDAIRVLLDASAATLMLRPPTFDRPASMFNMPPRDTYPRYPENYNTLYHSLDPFVDLPLGIVTTVDEFLGEREWCESDIYREFLERVDIRYVLGADIPLEDGAVCRLRLCRRHDATNFSASDKALCAALLPHLKRAVDLYSRVDGAKSERELYERAVDRMLIGMVILDDHGNVLRANAAARKVLDENDGIRLRNRMFEIADPQELRRFRSLVQRSIESISAHDDASGDMVQAMSISRPSGKSRIGLLIRGIPLSEWTEENKWCPACVVFIRDPAISSQTSIGVLRQLFEFTPSEASLAILLVNGHSVEEATAELGVKMTTTRAHLRSIFFKVGVTRQSELVRTLLNSVMALG